MRFRRAQVYPRTRMCYRATIDTVQWTLPTREACGAAFSGAAWSTRHGCQNAVRQTVSLHVEGGAGVRRAIDAYSPRRVQSALAVSTFPSYVPLRTYEGFFRLLLGPLFGFEGRLGLIDLERTDPRHAGNSHRQHCDRSQQPATRTMRSGIDQDPTVRTPHRGTQGRLRKNLWGLRMAEATRRLWCCQLPRLEALLQRTATATATPGAPPPTRSTERFG